MRSLLTALAYGASVVAKSKCAPRNDMIFFATPRLLTARLLAGVMGRVILGGKDVTGMAYPEGFR